MKKFKLLLLLLFCLDHHYTFSQVELQWQNNFGGTGDEELVEMYPTNDGGFILFGYSSSNDNDVSGNHGLRDFWIVKLDENRAIQWQKSYGGTQDDYCLEGKVTFDGGYVVIGSTYSPDGDVVGHQGFEDLWIINLDQAGEVIWKKTIGTTKNDLGYDVLPLQEGGFILVGVFNDSSLTDNDVAVWKLNESGDILWTKSIGGSMLDELYNIERATDGGFILCGRTQSNDGDISGNHGLDDAWIVKLDQDGEIEWQKVMGGSNSDFAQKALALDDGGYLISGYSASEDGDVTVSKGKLDYWMIRLDAAGNLIWQKSFGGSNLDVALCNPIVFNDGFLVGGWSRSTDGDVGGLHGIFGDMWVVKLDTLGNLEWEKNIGGTGFDDGRVLVPVDGNAFIIAGTSTSSDGDILANYGGQDYFMCRVDVVTDVKDVYQQDNIRIFPIPASEKINVQTTDNGDIIQITLLDIQGNVLIHANFDGELDISGVSSGTYLVKIELGSGKNYFKKVIKQ
ncbi:MAG: T9SS type A sorting domain-containing protein [Lewinellaceae bacterium]|nr:T9SS type A sorting domain-containing protein [Lewinellaceae bacterium]